VVRFGGEKYIFRVPGFLFLLYIQNKFFWTQQNLGGQKIGGHSLNAPMATGLHGSRIPFGADDAN